MRAISTPQYTIGVLIWLSALRNICMFGSINNKFSHRKACVRLPVSKDKLFYPSETRKLLQN